MKTDTFLPTRSSLLRRLKNWEDRESWREFFNLYGKLIFSVAIKAIKAGLTEAEAEDVVQQTMLVVARKMPGLSMTRRWVRSRVGCCSSRGEIRRLQAALR